MKKIFSSLVMAAALLLFQSCEDQLDVINPNEPTVDVLNSEAGIKRLALGIYFNGLDINYLWLTQGNHEAMGDVMYIPWGNFGWRWVNQTSSITLTDGTVVTPPQGGSQGEELLLRNTRAFGNDNAFYHEWFSMYNVNNVANLILETAAGDIEFTGDAATKQGALQAWAHWWKGFAYSRLGSMYIAGLVIDDFNSTNSDYVTNTEIIAEANRQFDLAAGILGGISDGEAYREILLAGLPDFTNNGGTEYPTPQEWIRNINTMKARNLLVNTKRRDMTAGDWQQVLQLTNAGLQQGDFTFDMRQDNNNFLFTGWVPPRFFMGWFFPSERLIDDYKEDDARFDRNFTTRSDVRVNQSGRGIQYGTRYNFVDIDEGGDLVSETPLAAKLILAGSYEENELMKAEAKIFTNDIEGGLEHIDAVRTLQDAQLPAVAGTGLTQEQAIEELRIERRVGLLLRGLAFYDARRWGVTEPLADGGGARGPVLVPGTGGFEVDENALLNYNYLDYWGVPDNELTFNAPGEGAANVNVSPR